MKNKWAAYFKKKQLIRWDMRKILMGYAVPVLYSVFCIVFYVYDETGDDMGSAWDLSQIGHITNIRINKILAEFIRFLNYTFPIVSWWPVFLMIINTFILILICRKLIIKILPGWVLLISMFIIAVSSNLSLFCGANFTRTSTILIVISTLYIIDYLKKEDKSKIDFMMGCIGIIIGSFIRSNSLVFGFGMTVALYFILNGLNKKEILSLTILFIIFFFISIYPQKLLFDEEEKEYRKWEEASATVVNYFSLIPRYENNEDLYASIGITKENLELIENRNMPHDLDIYSYSVIKKIGSVKHHFMPFQVAMLMAKNCIRFSKNIWIWSMITVVLAIAFYDLKRKIRTVFCLLTVYGMLLFIALLGRIPVRVSDCVAYTLTIVTIFSIANFISERRTNTQRDSLYLCNKIKRVIRFGISTSIILYAVVTLYSFFILCSPRALINITKQKEDRIVLKQTVEALSKRKGLIYLFSARGGSGLSSTGAFTYFEYMPKNFASNQYYLFGGSIRQPYYINELKTYGVENPMKALFEMDNVYSDYDEEVLDFLRRNYGKDIDVKVVEEINGYQIVKYYRRER